MAPFYLVHCNGNLLGDKVILSAVCRYLSRRSSVEIIGVEGKEGLSMARFLVPPTRILQYSSLFNLLSKSDEPGIGVAPLDKNSSSFPCRLSPGITECSLWNLVQHASRAGCPPAIKPLALEQVVEITRGVRADVLLHVRFLPRSKNRNSDTSIVSQVLRQLSSAGYFCRVIGDESVHLCEMLVGMPNVQWELGRLSLERLMALIQSSSVFVGGDSGPRHLATALGQPVLCLGPWNRRFGPFPQFQGQILTAENASDVTRLLDGLNSLPIAV